MAEIWIWPLLILTLLAVSGTLVLADIRQSTRSRITRHYRCPTSGEEVEAVLLSDQLDPCRYLDVVRCSAFAGGAVECGRQCLRLTKDDIIRQHEDVLFAAARATPPGVPGLPAPPGGSPAHWLGPTSACSSSWRVIVRSRIGRKTSSSF